MTASNTPKPGDERTPDERPDATTEILAGLADPDRTPTEVLGPDADRTPTAALDPDADRTPTEVLADADDARTTKVLPEASAHSTLVTPKPKATDPTRVRPVSGAADSPTAPAAGSAPAGPSLTPPPPASAPAPGQAASAASPTSGNSGLAGKSGGRGPVGAGAGARSADPFGPPRTSDTAPGGYPRPHVRWAGIIWGLVFAASAALLLWVLADDDRRTAVGDWWATLTPIGFALTALLVAGGLLLIGGLAGLARRLTHRRA